MSRPVVIDASVVLRRLLDHSPMADEVIRRDQLSAPGVLVPETLNGLANAMRFAGLAVEDAAGLLEQFLRLPIELVSDLDLAGQTLGVTIELDLSAYDASYVALALARDVPLVTADKPVAASYPRSELIP